MGRRKPVDASAPEARTVRVRKRKPREGKKRAMNLVMLDSNAAKLEGYAVIKRTTPAEVVQDWIERHTHGMRLSIPGEGAVGEGEDAAA